MKAISVLRGRVLLTIKYTICMCYYQVLFCAVIIHPASLSIILVDLASQLVFGYFFTFNETMFERSTLLFHPLMALLCVTLLFAKLQISFAHSNKVLQSQPSSFSFLTLSPQKAPSHTHTHTSQLIGILFYYIIKCTHLVHKHFAHTLHCLHIPQSAKRDNKLCDSMHSMTFATEEKEDEEEKGCVVGGD